MKAAKEEREVICIIPALEGACHVCGAHGRHNHFDRALHDLICVACWLPLRAAEDVCRELLFDAGPLGPQALQACIEDFEMSGFRAVPYFWRRVR